MSLSIEYLILLLVIIFCIIWDEENKHAFVVLMLIMTFMGVFRGLNVGSDHAGWEQDFYIIKSFGSSYYHDFEIGYVSLILFFKHFSNDWLWFSGLTFLVPMIGTFYFIKQYKISYAWAIFIFYIFGIYFAAFNSMRQYMAICSIAAFSYLLNEKKYLIFALLTIAVALLLHKSTIIMLLLIPIHLFVQNKHIHKVYLYLIIIFSYLLSYVDVKIIILPILAILDFIGLAGDYSQYASSEAHLNSNIYALVLTLYVLLLVFVSDNNDFSSEKYTVVLFIVLYNIFNLLSIYGTRVAYPFEYYLIVYVPMLLKKLNGTRNGIILKIATLVCGLGYFLACFAISNVSSVNPYENWLFE